MVFVENSTEDKWAERPVAFGLTGNAIGPTPKSQQIEFPKELLPVLQAYQSANPGQPIKDFSRLKPYATTSAQQNALDGFIGMLQNK
jgi:hypothetical protein